MARLECSGPANLAKGHAVRSSGVKSVDHRMIKKALEYPDLTFPIILGDTLGAVVLLAALGFVTLRATAAERFVASSRTRKKAC